jgi:4a-hydroxytetrahydrobiopterin dehydratase
MKIFSDKEISNYLTINLKKWVYENGAIRRDFEFRNFVEAFSFMTSVALVAEKSVHHPDWSNVYNKVSIALNTHSARGVTQMDFNLANMIEIVYENFGKL